MLDIHPSDWPKTEEGKNERAHLVVWVGRVLMAIAFLAFIAFATKAYAEPIYQANAENVNVVLFNDPCELTNHITNLKYKAEWHEGGKVIKGCWGPRPDYGLVQFYFEDKTTGLIPLQELAPVRGA
jgi:hypothetical protein